MGGCIQNPLSEALHLELKFQAAYVCIQDDWALSARGGMFHSYENDLGQESFWKFIVLETQFLRSMSFFIF